MSKIKFSLDNQCYQSKPADEDAAKISNRIGRLIKELHLSRLRASALDISLDGRTFCPATFKDGKRSKESFEQQQLFALDFDGGISFEEVKTRTEKYELPILFAYDTLSTEHDKFRVVFLNDVSVTDRKVAETMQQAMGRCF
jgi:hypothetical protein